MSPRSMCRRECVVKLMLFDSSVQSLVNKSRVEKFDVSKSWLEEFDVSKMLREEKERIGKTRIIIILWLHLPTATFFK